jgi:formylglycine-generating enzyme required for sulfatase activity
MATCTACGAHESCWINGSQARCVATPVQLPTGLAIDATEVTRAQYSAWLATTPAATSQPVRCAWNESFAADEECMGLPSVCQGDECGTHPQPCIDLCDAEAYCASTGARLCTRAEWTSACSSDGMYPAAYGETFVAGTCNDYTIYGETTVPVTSKPGCQAPDDSGFAGVFDLIGNVAEWIDDCRSAEGAADVCNPHGLSFGIGAAAPICEQSTYAERSEAADNLGFRCCSSAR